ncbi:DUF4282 domain-containing protein [Sulfurimonas sp. NW9]|uniref:DUF4282 domain-containing protein n=1 Tax=Sulfurimonas sp. NW9 TaxID=2922728 RepID=UPI003DAA0830
MEDAFFSYKKIFFFEREGFRQTKQTCAYLFFGVIFLCMELCLRILFEGMIGYFDMHDYLYKISQKV